MAQPNVLLAEGIVPYKDCNHTILCLIGIYTHVVAAVCNEPSKKTKTVNGYKTSIYGTMFH